MAFYEHNDYQSMLRLPGLPDIEISRATREPCIVCGHPTGDCAGTLPPPTRLIGDSPLESLKASQTIFLDHDIFEEREIVAGRTVKILKYRAGMQIPIEEAKKLGLI